MTARPLKLVRNIGVDADAAPPMTVTLSEAESRRLVAAHGVPVSPFVTATSAEEARRAVAEQPDLSYPVVAKLCGRSIAHKTERGLVRLGVADEAELGRAAEALLGTATAADGQVELLVSSMITGQRELIAGATVDPQFGPVLMFGIGGILAEAIRDIGFRLIPVTAVDIEELIADLAGQRLLGELRGEPAADRGALVEALLALARTAVGVPGIVSIDLNPLILHAGRPVAVDALVEIDDESRPAAGSLPTTSGAEP